MLETECRNLRRGNVKGWMSAIITHRVGEKHFG
jgi:hypothetical protein